MPSAVPRQTIDFSDAKHPAATTQLTMPSCDDCARNLNGPGWIIQVHGRMTFNLQLDAVEDVVLTLLLAPWSGGDKAEYDVVVNDQMLVHRKGMSLFSEKDWRPETVTMPAGWLKVGGNSIVLNVSEHGGATVNVKSVTVESASAQAAV